MRKDVGRSAARAKVESNDRLQRISTMRAQDAVHASAVEMQRNHRNEAELELGEQESSKEEAERRGAGTRRKAAAGENALEQGVWKQQRERLAVLEG